MEGTDQIPGGDTKHIPGGNGSGENTPGEFTDKVDYDTYLKAVNQEKNAKARLKETEDKLAKYEAARKEEEETKLKQQGEYKKLLGQRDKQLQDLEESNKQLKKSMLDSVKLSKVIEKIGGRVKRNEYLNFIDVDKIPYDEETKSFDDEMIKSVASDFVKSYTELIDFKTGKLPSDAASAAETLSYDEWRKLPLKDKKAKLKLVKDYKKFG